MGVLTVATDGSCLVNPGGAIGWAWADETGRWQANGYRSGTNQIAELLGFLAVLKAFPNTNLHVQLDSQYTMNIASKWMWGWAKNNWVKKGGPIKNLNIIKAIHAELVRRQKSNVSIEYEWVKGHNGHDLNEVVDVEARNAAIRVRDKKKAYKDSAGNPDSSRQHPVVALAASP